jgi:hypothetical protein
LDGEHFNKSQHKQKGGLLKMDKKLLAFSIFSVLLFFLAAMFPVKANAIPAFARKYKTSCMTCHATYPRMTAVGEAFRLNGYKMPGGDEIYSKEKPVSMGSEAYKRMFPKSVWPSDIPYLPPISLRVIGDIEWDIGDNASERDSRWKMEFPHEIALIAAGSFGDNMSFYTELEWEHPDDLEQGFAAWLMWEDVFIENALNFKGGSVGRYEISLPNMRDHDKITKERYLYHNEITRGLDGPGIEVNGFGKMWRYAAGFVKPQDEFGDAGYYAQGSLKFGGLGYDGEGGTSEEGGLKTSPAGYWLDDAVFIGAFYYNGDDNIDRYGIDARWNYKDFALKLGWAIADNDLPNMDISVWTAEAEYFVLPWLQPYFRYENLSSDENNNDVARIACGAAILARANIKFNLEGRFYTDNEPKEAAGDNKNVDDRVFVRLDFAY